MFSIVSRRCFKGSLSKSVKISRHSSAMKKEPSKQLTIEQLVQKSIDRSAEVENESHSRPRSVTDAPTIHQTMAGRRRFYKDVGVAPVPEQPGYFKVTLDGRALKTPARGPLFLPNKDIAACIAAEWDAQTSVQKGIEPVSMPMMTLASTAIDQIQVNRDTTIANCIAYLPTDSALFLTHDMDRLLLLKQKTHYAPVVRWLNRLLDIDLTSTQNMSARIAHCKVAAHKLRLVLESMDHFTLACVQSATYECKSLVLALGYIGRYLTLDQVKAASRLEEEFQLEIWGVVEGGHDMDRLNNSVNLASSGLFMSLYMPAGKHAAMLDTWRTIGELVNESHVATAAAAAVEGSANKK